MPAAYPRTCINGPPDNGDRCWWTYEPAAVRGGGIQQGKVPLVIDMHGGGGCASDQAFSSGFKELSDTLGSNSSFITVWPQGYNSQWGTCGSDCDMTEAENNGKSIHSVDDLTFLSTMVAKIVQAADSRIDVERIYVTGFSMGCMMSHRFALERSKIVAGFGCHGGTLIQPGSNLAAQKTRFDLQPMPVYMTGGSSDTWFDLAKPIFDTWAQWNGCASASTTANVNLPAAASAPASATLKVSSSCIAASEVARLELVGGVHVPDSRMAKYTWNFLKNHKRAGALTALPASSVQVVATGKPTATAIASPTGAKPTAEPTIVKSTTEVTAKPTGSPITKPTTTATKLCAGLANKHVSCSAAGYSQHCEGQYAAWMGKNCAFLCCEAKKEAESTAKQDANQNCASWKKFCTDVRYAVFMKGNCAKTCGSQSVEAKCADSKNSDDRCPVFGARYCKSNTYAAWMQSHCAAKCCTVSAKCAGKSDLTDCTRYAAAFCTDPKYSSWMNQNCAAHCCHAAVDSYYRE
mmetsp:Transcript_11342/g.21585  ORF Transcript_11342/g.21585 Transcript_11342/m.21585 type:complete len:520 (-) Transcript_11342:86-1645(-)